MVYFEITTAIIVNTDFNIYVLASFVCSQLPFFHNIIVVLELCVFVFCASII